MSGPQRCWCVAALAAALCIACGGETEAQADASQEQPYLAGPEDIARASVGQLLTGTTISGELTSDQTAAVRAQISGEIDEVRADVGDRVRQGQVVVRIRAASEREEVTSAQAAVATAEPTRQKNRSMPSSPPFSNESIKSKFRRDTRSLRAATSKINKRFSDASSSPWPSPWA